MARIKSKAYFLLFLGFFLSSATPIQAGDCGFGHCFGALGVTNDGLPTRATNLQTATKAEERINETCGTDGCLLVEVFSDGCAAIARYNRDGVFFGFAETEGDASAEALALCSQDGSRTCYVSAQVCTR